MTVKHLKPKKWLKWPYNVKGDWNTLRGIWFDMMFPWCDSHYNDVILMFLIYFFLILP